MTLKWPLNPNEMPWGKFVKVNDETGEVEVTDERPEGGKVDFWICPLFLQFWTWKLLADSEFGVCALCERAIVYRSGTALKNGNAPKICMECAQKTIGK